MTSTEINKSCNDVIKIGRAQDGKLIEDIEILKTRYEDCQGRKVGNYLKQAREADKLNIMSILEEMPGAKVSIGFGEVTIGIPEGVLLEDVDRVINKAMRDSMSVEKWTKIVTTKVMT